jgi:glutamate/tyrosine decarboxylase-like PLP-dependent enzyme
MAPRRSSIDINPLFSRPGEATERPRFALADDPMLPETAYQIVHDEAMLDGNARTNLATFVSIWMEPAATMLYSEAYDKNMIDKDEHRTLDGHDLASYVDENTIGVVAIMGVTYTGMYEPVREIAAALDKAPGAGPD